MKFCLFTMGRWETIGKMLDMTLPNKEEFCSRHGYSLHFEEWDGGIFPGFYRLPILIHLLKCGYYDYVFWLGSDCLITNLTLKLEDLVDDRYGIIMATDFTQIQMDSFLVQPKHGTIELLEKVWAHRNNPIGPWYEQSTLDALIQQPPYKGIVKIVPQRKMNAYRHKWYKEWEAINSKVRRRLDCLGTDGEWQRGDFVFHIPGRPLHTKIMALAEVHPLIQR